MDKIEKIRQEIERRMKTCDANSETPNQLLWAELAALLPFLDTLQEPEVDLEEYIEKEIAHYGLSLTEASYGTFSASEIERMMRRFYELGLKKAK